LKSLGSPPPPQKLLRHVAGAPPLVEEAFQGQPDYPSVNLVLGDLDVLIPSLIDYLWDRVLYLDLYYLG
jgi:hypothetical protein